jgi:hypothetical protein
LGLPAIKRRELLAIAFELNVEDYVSEIAFEWNEWGGPGTADRLRKIAESLASFTKNAKRNPRDFINAISEWEEDLDFLFHEYYVGVFHFGWVKT